MKATKLLALLCAAALCLALAGCGGAKPTASAATPQDYADAVTAARTAEQNDAFPVVSGGADTELAVTGLSGDDAKNQAEMLSAVLGFDASLCDAYAFSVSMMNVHSYGVGVFRPVEGQADAVKAMAEAFVAAQVKAQEHYLPDQYEIAKAAIVETQPTGEVILVMCENADDVAASLRASLAA